MQAQNQTLAGTRGSTQPPVQALSLVSTSFDVPAAVLCCEQVDSSAHLESLKDNSKQKNKDTEC